MPIVICRYCMKVGFGKSVDEQWDDVREHEKKEHPQEISEEEEIID